MNIASQNSVSILFTGDEIRAILLDHIKRTAPGFVNKNMKMVDNAVAIPDVSFIWNREESKDLKTGA